MLKTLALCAAVAGFGLPALAQAGSDKDRDDQFTQQDEQQVRQLEQQRQSALQNNQPDKLSQIYSDDATTQNAQGEKARGQEQIQKQAKKDAQSMKQASVVTNVIAIDPIDDDTALIEAARRVAPIDKPNQSVTFHAFSIAEKEDGEWKLIATREFATMPLASVVQSQKQGTGGSGEQTGEQPQPESQPQQQPDQPKD